MAEILFQVLFLQFWPTATACLGGGSHPCWAPPWVEAPTDSSLGRMRWDCSQCGAWTFVCWSAPLRAKRQQVSRQTDGHITRQMLLGCKSVIILRGVPCKFMGHCLVGCWAVKCSHSVDICLDPQSVFAQKIYARLERRQDQTKANQQHLGKISSPPSTCENFLITSAMGIHIYIYRDTVLQTFSPGNKFKTFKSFSLLKHLDVKVLHKNSWV